MKEEFSQSIFTKESSLSNLYQEIWKYLSNTTVPFNWIKDCPSQYQYVLKKNSRLSSTWENLVEQKFR